MIFRLLTAILLAGTALDGSPAWAGEAPGAALAADIPISHHDRIYAAEQFSNTVSVIDPASNTLLGVIRLGDPSPMNFSLIRQDKEHADQEALDRLKTDLAHAFAAPDSSYQPLTAAEIIARNRR